MIKKLVDIELKPCPFCGGKAYITSAGEIDKNNNYIENAFKAACVKCYIGTPFRESRELVISQWNKRAKE